MITPEIPQLDPLRVQVRKHALLNEISTKPSRRWWHIAAPATALAASALIVAVMGMPVSPPAFASWSAEPRAPGGAAPEAGCPGPWEATPLEQAGKPVRDYRGDNVLSVVSALGTADGLNIHEVVICLRTPEFTKVATVRPEQRTSQWFEVSGTTEFEVNGAVARTLIGRVDKNVRRVQVDTSDGRQVTATVEDSWVAAWWPSKADAKSVTMFDRAGNVLGTVVPHTR